MENSSGEIKNTISGGIQAVDRCVLTDVVLHVADVEGGGGHGHAQAVLLLDQDGLVEAPLLQVVHGQLTAAQLHHHVVSAGGRTQGGTNAVRLCDVNVPGYRRLTGSAP